MTKTLTCPHCGESFSDAEGATDGPREYHSECWRVVSHLRDAHEVRCLDATGYPASLIAGRIYRTAGTTGEEARQGLVRVVDESGEGYLYHTRRFG